MSSKETEVQTKSTDCLFSGKDWDYPKQDPNPTRSGVRSEKPISSK